MERVDWCERESTRGVGDHRSMVFGAAGAHWEMDVLILISWSQRLRERNKDARLKSVAFLFFVFLLSSSFGTELLRVGPIILLALRFN